METSNRADPADNDNYFGNHHYAYYGENHYTRFDDNSQVGADSTTGFNIVAIGGSSLCRCLTQLVNRHEA
jgi:hypothetical protein